MSDVIVTIAHLRAAKMCSREPRKWFERYGLSWSEFVTNGIPASQLRATGDSLCEPVIKVAEEEAASGG